MLNFRKTLIVFSVALAILIIADFSGRVSFWLYIGIVLALILLLTWGSIKIQAGFYLRSLCSGSRDKKAVCLTFDDGPDEFVTPMILDILKKHQLKATFFIVGSKAEKHPEILERINREGHIIGGHSYSHHFFFDLFSALKMKQELSQTADYIYRVTGRKIRLFRPPYGVTNPTIAKVIRDLDFSSVGWSLRSKDTVIEDKVQLFNRLKLKVKAGDIILLHDSRTWTVSLLETFLKYLNEQQYIVERIDSFLNIKAYVN
jgi:peptidoglycan-N-acetylglucosamine deacetylase